jgi:ATP-dependent DNA helicase RecQ
MKKFRELEKYSELNPVRDHIQLRFQETESGKELKAIIKELRTSLNPEFSRAIIFCTSRKLTEESSDEVNAKFRDHEALSGKAGFYHAGMDSETREKTFNRYKDGSLAILFATKAFGMGMDIPNIHHVSHLGPSGSFEDYLQEVGRSGRNEGALKKAGFSIENPIQAICYHSKDSFPKYRDWIQRTQISWNDLCNVYEVYKDYRSQFISGNDTRENRDFLPIPLNILSTSLKYMDAEADLGSLFRLSLYWLQQADRINSRYYVPAFLEFENNGFFDKDLGDQILDNDLKKLYTYIRKIYAQEFQETDSTLLEGTGLMKNLEVNRDEMFLLILKAQKKGLVKLVNKLNVNLTENCSHDLEIHKIKRTDGFQFIKALKAIALSLINEFRRDEKVELENENLQILIEEMESSVLFEDFLEKATNYGDREMFEIFLKSKDLRVEKKNRPEFAIWFNEKRRMQPELLELLQKQRQILKSNKSSTILKTAFFVLNLHPGLSITSKFSEETGAIIQIVKLETDRQELLNFVDEFCGNSEKLLVELMKESSRIVDINELLLRLPLKEPRYSEVENLFFLLRKLGYIRFQGGLVPMAIEMKFDNLAELGELAKDEDLRISYIETIRMKKLRLIVLECFSQLSDPTRQTDLIRDYFQGKNSKEIIKLVETYSKDSVKLLGPYRAEALKERVEGLNSHQAEVYHAGIRTHLSVIAGPGTGKTHTLVLRVARLIQEENISPNKILVLAYNRAVVEELKLRLKTLFSALGYKSLINSLQVYTYSGLVGSVLKQNGFRETELDNWEEEFLKLYKQKGRNILGRFSDVEYVFIDEFQDVTNKRLEILKVVAPTYRSFITAIGDPNQSIYGFDRIKEGGKRGPEEYYISFNKEYSPVEKNLTINYRSTPEIIEASKNSLPTGARVLPIEPNPDIETFSGNVDIYEGDGEWLSKFYNLLKDKQNNEIAVLFRSNEELYKDFEIVKALAAPEGYKVEIKGSATSFTKQREIAYVLEVINRGRAGALVESKEGISEYINNNIKVNFPNWDFDLLDDFVRLFNYFYEHYNENLTYGDFVDFVTEITAKDDGQLFKILKAQREITIPTVILTTIHRVKGMEYQNVIVPASTSKLPFDHRTQDFTAGEYQEILDEEKRLRYVAFSRAKTNLIVEVWERENCIESGETYSPEVASRGVGVPVKNGDNNIRISWKAGNGQYFTNIHSNIHSDLKIGGSLTIKPDNYNNYGLWNGRIMIEKFMDNYIGRFNGNTLAGIYVDSIVRYTSEECQRYDERYNKRYFQNWSQDAVNRGYIYLVNFFGYAQPEELSKTRHQEKLREIKKRSEMILA